MDTFKFEECPQPGLPTESLPGEYDSPPSGLGARAAHFPSTPTALGKILMKLEEEKRKDDNLAFPRLQWEFVDLGPELTLKILLSASSPLSIQPIQNLVIFSLCIFLTIKIFFC